MPVKEEIMAALNELVLAKLAEIEKGQEELKASLDELIKRVKRIGRPQNDFDDLEDLQAAGFSHEQAVAVVRARYEIKQSTKAELDEVGFKVEGELKAAGFLPEKAKVIVNLMKDFRLSSG